MSAEQKKRVAVAALTGTETVTQIAIENKSSRKFVRGQKVMRILMIVIKDSGDRDRPVGALRAGG